MTRLLSTTAIALLLAGGTALAQSSGPATPTDPVANHQPAQAQTSWQPAEGSWMSDDLIGAEVESDRGDILGEIESLIITLNTNAEVSMDPMADSRPDNSTAPGKPATGSTEAPAASDGSVETSQDGSAAGGGMPAEENQAAEPDATADEPVVAAGPEPLSNGGETVMTPTDHQIATAQVTDVVIGIGGFLGIGAKPVAIPIDQLEFFSGSNGERKIVLSTTIEQLESMPAFVTRDDGLAGSGSTAAPVTPD